MITILPVPIPPAQTTIPGRGPGKIIIAGVAMLLVDMILKLATATALTLSVVQVAVASVKELAAALKYVPGVAG